MKSLKELITHELNEFRWRLKINFNFSASELENANVFNIIDKIVQRYGPDDAVTFTLNILGDMNKNEQAKLLKEEYEKGKH